MKTKKTNNVAMPLNKYLSQSGICSRRNAVIYIKEGLVKVNNVVITEPGHKVSPGDKVKFKDKLIKSERKIYIVLNKPKNYITTLSDEKGRSTVIDLLRGAFKERLYPVGRLDRLTTGVILITNDGEFSQKLCHPSFEVKKVYSVVLDQQIKYDDILKIRSGITLADGPVTVDRIGYIPGKNRKHVRIQIHSGKNRIVRRIFKKIGYNVVKLDRTNYAGLTKRGVSLGRWRELTRQEITMLKKGGEVKHVPKRRIVKKRVVKKRVIKKK